MLFQRVNRSDPEKVFVVVKNSYTVALTNGQAVQWDFVTDYDGVSVERPTARATNGGFAFAGIAAETIAISGYGLVQVYGYHSAVRARTMTGGTVGLDYGRPIVLNAAGSLFCMESFATGSAVIQVFPGGFWMGAASTLWTTVAGAAFIKAM
jgi:hypothetical protein